MLKTYVCSLLLLVILLLIETTVLANIVYLPAVPDIMLAAVIYLALKNGSLAGEILGFSSGLMLDFLSGAPLGLNCLVRTVMGYVCGLFDKTFNSSGILLPALAGLIATAAKFILTNTVSFFYPQGQILVFNVFSLRSAFELVFNAITFPLMFAFFSLFDFLLIKKGTRP
jgi:rod shape-determining protein MreD